MDFSTIEITAKNVRGNNVDFSTIEITSKKVRGNNMDFLTIEITSKKVPENDVDFLISEITSKKYVETTWKFVDFGLRRIDVISTLNRRRFDVMCPLGPLKFERRYILLHETLSLLLIRTDC